MTKLITIDVNFDKENKEYVFVANIIAPKQEDIIILKDLLEDQEHRTNIHCIGLKLNYSSQYCYKNFPPICIKGRIFIRKLSDDITIPEAISIIGNTILSFTS